MSRRPTRALAPPPFPLKPMDARASELLFIVTESPEGGYEARAVGASIFTKADDLAGLREAVRDAVACHFDDGEGPASSRLHA